MCNDSLQKHYIYCLVCPIDYSIKYVGLTKNPKQRLLAHLNNTEATIEKKKWITDLREKGMKPIMEIICEVNGLRKAKAKEKSFIKAYSSSQVLLNGHLNKKRKNPRKGISANQYLSIKHKINGISNV